jgi:L-methionine (R)-S-oxide reductase
MRIYQPTSENSAPDLEKIALYAELTAEVDSLLSGEVDVIANLANTAAAIYRALPSVNWAGF